MTIRRIVLRIVPLSGLVLAGVAAAQTNSLESLGEEIVRVSNLYADSYKRCLSESSLYTEDKLKRQLCRSSLYAYANDLERVNGNLHAWLDHPDLTPQQRAEVREFYNANLETIEVARDAAGRYR